MSKRAGVVRQCYAGCTANLVIMAAGCLLGWPSPALPEIDQQDSVIRANAEQESWFASLVPLGAAIGPYPAGYLADKIGRKWTILGLTAPLLLSWMLVTFTRSIPAMFAGRFIGGIAVGAAYAIAPIYTGEIAQDNIRGGLGSTFYFFLSAGYLYEYAIGPYVSYVWLGIASMLVPAAFAVAFFFMPETPYYCLMKGRRELASKSLQWLRNATEQEVEQELLVMQEFMNETINNSGTYKDLFTTRRNLKALGLSCGLIGFEIFSGVDAVLIYNTEIFMLAGGSLTSNLSSIIIGVVMLVCAVVTPLLVDNSGRKPMLYASALGMVGSEISLGLYFYLRDVKGIHMSAVGWLPVVSVVVFVAFYSIGYGPLPYTIMGELFPTSIKGMAAAITASCDWIFGFIISKWFLSISTKFGMHVVFWFFAGFCLMSNVFVYFCLPETKTKSFKEIQATLCGKG